MLRSCSRFPAGQRGQSRIVLVNFALSTPSLRLPSQKNFRDARPSKAQSRACCRSSCAQLSRWSHCLRREPDRREPAQCQVVPPLSGEHAVRAAAIPGMASDNADARVMKSTRRSPRSVRSERSGMVESDNCGSGVRVEVHIIGLRNRAHHSHNVRHAMTHMFSAANYYRSYRNSSGAGAFARTCVTDIFATTIKLPTPGPFFRSYHRLTPRTRTNRCRTSLKTQLRYSTKPRKRHTHDGRLPPLPDFIEQHWGDYTPGAARRLGNSLPAAHEPAHLRRKSGISRRRQDDRPAPGRSSRARRRECATVANDRLGSGSCVRLSSCARIFLCLSMRRFPTTITIRPREQMDYLPEPDIFHDVFGHVPLHADPAFADFLQRYGHDCLRRPRRSRCRSHDEVILVHCGVRSRSGRRSKSLRQRPHLLPRR